jgi:hypothetical protein
MSLVLYLCILCSSNVGDPVLYQYIECIRDYMDSLPEDTCNMPDIEPASEGDEQLQSEPPTDVWLNVHSSVTHSLS